MGTTTSDINPRAFAPAGARLPEKRTHVTRLDCGLSLPLVLLLLAPGWARAAEEKPLPAFSDYPVSGSRNLKPAPVDLGSHPQARMFRTALRQGAQRGPNFAGHYAAVQWGCGTGCTVVALVNLRSGRVLFPQELHPVSFPWLADEKATMDKYDILHRKDSALLVVHGVHATHDKLGSYYFTMQDDQLRLIAVSEWTSRWNKTDANRAKE